MRKDFGFANFFLILLFLIVLIGASLVIVRIRSKNRSVAKQTPTAFDLSKIKDGFRQEKKESSKNPFGVMLGSNQLNIEQRIKIAKDLGAVYFRPNGLFLDRYNGMCLECEAVTNSGLKLVLTIRNNGGGGQPATPPTDYISYKNNVLDILDKYNPALLVVENEENSNKLFYSGTPKEYHQELKVACEASHEKGIPCTNGGLVSSLVVALVADYYEEQGEPAKAEEFLKRSLDDEKFQQVKKMGTTTAGKALVKRGKELLAGYKSAGADYVNFHWYVADTQALEEAVKYLEKVSGLPAVTNEIGQQENTDPNQTITVMQKTLELELPFVVWFSIDIDDLGGARALMDPDGALRPNGEAFREFVFSEF